MTSSAPSKRAANSSAGNYRSEWRRLWQDDRLSKQLIRAGFETKASYYTWVKPCVLSLSELRADEVAKLYYFLSFQNDDNKIPRNLPELMEKDGVEWNHVLEKYVDENLIILEGEYFRPNELFSGRRNPERTISIDMNAEGFSFWMVNIQYMRYLSLLHKDRLTLKTIGQCFQLLPYLNQRYNVLCEKPMETRLKDIVPLTSSQIVKLLGISKMSGSRFLERMAERRCFPSGYFTLGDWMELPHGGRAFMVNPNLVYTAETERYLFNLDWKWKPVLIDCGEHLRWDGGDI